MPIGPVTAPQPPFRLKSINLSFSVEWPFSPVFAVDEDGNPVVDENGDPVQDTYTLADGSTAPRYNMGSTYIQGTTVDANGNAGPRIEGNESDLTPDFLLAVLAAANAPTGLPALIAKTVDADGNPTIVGVAE